MCTGRVIGSGGENVKRLSEDFSVLVDIPRLEQITGDEVKIVVYGLDKDSVGQVVQSIRGATRSASKSNSKRSKQNQANSGGSARSDLVPDQVPRR